MSRSSRFFILLALGVSVGLWACAEDVTDPVVDQRSAALTAGIEVGCVDFSAKIFAGQHIDVGTYVVSSDGESLQVSIDLQDEWLVQLIHLHASVDPVPLNPQGTPVPGAFAHHFPLDPAVDSVSVSVPLDRLGLQCGETFHFALHLEVIRYGDIGLEEETAWGFGDGIFDSRRWGWYSVFTLCCPPPVDEGCTLTQGYWRTHHRHARVDALRIAWPIDEDTLLCGQTYLEILHRAPRGSAFYILGQQAIAAQLNLASGASADDEILYAVKEAFVLLERCVLSREEARRAIALSSLLDAYNNGDIGPGHCDSDDDEVD